MSLHFGWTHGANKVVIGPKRHWWKLQTQKNSIKNLMAGTITWMTKKKAKGRPKRQSQ